MDELQSLIDGIKAKARRTWTGEENRALAVEKLIHQVLENYSSVLKLDKLDILKAIEGKRSYCVVNYYQDAKFPILKDPVKVFQNLEEFQKEYPSKIFVCPNCNGHSTNPYECNSPDLYNGIKCDWKAYGLFGCMGKGLKLTFIDKFLENPRVDQIFLPLELSVKEEATA